MKLDMIPYLLTSYTPTFNTTTLFYDTITFSLISIRYIVAPKLWNTLPESVKHAKSIDSFKKNLKTFLFKTTY